jgi:hypothetical protein
MKWYSPFFVALILYIGWSSTLSCTPDVHLNPRWIYTEMGWFPREISGLRQLFIEYTPFGEEYRSLITMRWNGMGQTLKSQRLDAVFTSGSDNPGQWLERSYRKQEFNAFGDLVAWEIGSFSGNSEVRTRDLVASDLVALPQWLMKTTQQNHQGRPLVQEAYLGRDSAQGFSFGKAYWDYQGNELQAITSPDNFPLSTRLNLPVESIVYRREGEKTTESFYGPGRDLVFQQTRDRHGRLWALKDPLQNRSFAARWEEDSITAFFNDAEEDPSGALGWDYGDIFEDGSLKNYTWYSPLYNEPLQIDFFRGSDSDQEFGKIVLRFPGAKTIATLRAASEFIHYDPSSQKESLEFRGFRPSPGQERDPFAGEFSPYVLRIRKNGLPVFFGEYGLGDSALGDGAEAYLIRSVEVEYF